MEYVTIVMLNVTMRRNLTVAVSVKANIMVSTKVLRGLTLQASSKQRQSRKEQHWIDSFREVL